MYKSSPQHPSGSSYARFTFDGISRLSILGQRIVEKSSAYRDPDLLQEIFCDNLFQLFVLRGVRFGCISWRNGFPDLLEILAMSRLIGTVVIFSVKKPLLGTSGEYIVIVKCIMRCGSRLAPWPPVHWCETAGELKSNFLRLFFVNSEHLEFSLFKFLWTVNI